MGIWKTIKAAFGRGTSTPPDARRLNAVDELALSASLRTIHVGARGWITLSEARDLFSTMDDQYAFGEIGHHRGSRPAEPSGMGAGLPTVGSIDDDRPR